MRPIWSALAFVAFVATTVVTDDDDPPAWLKEFSIEATQPVEASIINADLKLKALIKKDSTEDADSEDAEDDLEVELEIIGYDYPSNFVEDSTCENKVGITVDGETVCDLTSITFEKTLNTAEMTLSFGDGIIRNSEEKPTNIVLHIDIHELAENEHKPNGEENWLQTFDTNFVIQREGRTALIYFEWLSELLQANVKSMTKSLGGQYITKSYKARRILLSKNNWQAFFAAWNAL